VGFQSFLKDTLLHLYIRKSLAVLKGGLFSQPSPMTHHHHGLTFGNLGKFSGGHTLGPFRPFGGKTRCVEKLSHSGCLDTEVHVLWK